MHDFQHIRFWNCLIVLLLLTLEPVHTFLHGNLEPAPYLQSTASVTVAPAHLKEAPEAEPNQQELSPEECLLCNGLLTLFACRVPTIPLARPHNDVQGFHSLIFHPGIPHTLSDARAPPKNS